MESIVRILNKCKVREFKEKYLKLEVNSIRLTNLKTFIIRLTVIFLNLIHKERMFRLVCQRKALIAFTNKSRSLI